MGSNAVLFIAGHRMGLHGGGNTCAQISRAYTRAGYQVTYVAPESKFKHFEEGINQVPMGGFQLGPWYSHFDRSDSILHIALPCTLGLRLLSSWPGRSFYHCRDNWSLWVKQRGRKWDWWEDGVEQRIVKKVDKSFAVNPKLALEVLGQDSVVHNGYDPTIFRWFGRTPRKVERVVTWGFSGGFFDESLFQSVANADRTIDYTVIGGKNGITQKTSDLPNVHFLGPKNIIELPHFAHEADAGIVIREKTGVPEYMDPIKSWEFLGSGLPFVSVGPKYPTGDDNPACKRVSSDPRMVAEKLKNIYDYVSIQKSDATPHTWDSRLNQILED